MKGKKSLTALILAVVSLLTLAGCTSREESAENTVPVTSVASICDTGAVGVIERYAGKVVSGQTEKIQRDESKKIDEVLVEEGDTVRAGEVLFTYDTQTMEFELEKLQLELEGLENSITASQTEITELENERASVSSSQQLAYTLQIQSAEADIREAEYNKTLKQREISNMQASMSDVKVAAGIGGRVMSVAEIGDEDNGDYSYYNDSSDNAFITISDLDTFRVEGSINELNAGMLTEGLSVLVRSRKDESQTWTGRIESIDWDNPEKSNSDNYYYYSDSGDDMTSSSKYPFYVTLDSKDGLILGQHVYIEPNYGQTEAKTGLWLPEYYLCDAEGEAWVWAVGKRDGLEKRSVTLGEYDGDLGEYQIIAGLSDEDYIAFPDDSLTAGMKASYVEESFDSYESYEDYDFESYESYENYSFDSYESYENYSFDSYESYEDYSFESYESDSFESFEDVTVSTAEAEG